MKGIVGTHASNFHLDDVTASLLLQYTTAFARHQLIRSLDVAELERACDLVFDIGGVYDHAALRYDHHQRGFHETFDAAHTTKLSACGLIYKHYGPEIIANLRRKYEPFGAPLTEAQLAWFHRKWYNVFFEAIDANDNGINQFDGDPKFLSTTSLPQRVAALNAHAGGVLRMDAFIDAQQLVKAELLDSFRWILFSLLPTVFERRREYDPLGRVLVLEERMNWKEILPELEKEEARRTGTLAQVLYVVSEDEARKQWGSIAVSVRPGSFEMRRPFPAPWRGLRDQELAAVCGVPSAVFTHSSGFLACAKTREDMMEMVARALAFE